MMILWNAILVGLGEVWAHKTRSLLSMLGIILGVSSLVGMGALVKGMENGMRETMTAVGGADKLWLEDQQVPPWQEHLADEAPGRTMRDVEALRAGAPLFRLVSPEMEVPRPSITRNGRDVRTSECVGVTSAVLEMNLHELAHGRFFTATDEERAANVCVIGAEIRDELFGAVDQEGREIVPLGETIYIQEQPFTVVGILTRYESESERRQREISARSAQQSAGPERRRGGRRRGQFWAKNSVVFMPLNTAWIRFRAAGAAASSSSRGFGPSPATGGTATTNNVPDPRLTAVDLKVADMEQMDVALQQARNVLLTTHRGIEDFAFRTQENTADAIATQIRNARLSGGIIAGIALVVGGIGIMNIMFASIQERVREVGICKAIGAGGGAVFAQVLMESLTIALIGAALGVVSSFGAVRILNLVSPTQTTPVIEPWLLLVAVACSAIVGLISGIFPAAKAARLDPISALRYE